MPASPPLLTLKVRLTSAEAFEVALFLFGLSFKAED
jgi:hypothetical protein